MSGLGKVILKVMENMAKVIGLEIHRRATKVVARVAKERLTGHVCQKAVSQEPRKASRSAYLSTLLQAASSPS
jgi:hypothetical protein